MSVMAISSYACEVCDKINKLFKSVIFSVQESRQLEANAKIAYLIKHEYHYHTLESLINEMNMKTKREYNVKRNQINNY